MTEPRQSIPYHHKWVAWCMGVVVFWLLLPTVAMSATVPLTVANPHSVPLVGQPVSSGIPFPKGALASADTVRLTNPDGIPIPLQPETLATWSDGSVKWLLLDFQADAPAGQSVVYTLQTDGAAAIGHAQPVTVSDAADHLIVDTGAAQFRISKTGFNLFDEVRLGGNVLVNRGNGGGLTLSPTAAPAPIFGNDVSAPAINSSNHPPTLTVERSGPLHTVIRVNGNLFTNGLLRMDYTARLHFYAGQSTVRVETRLENNTPATDPTLLDSFGQPVNAYHIGQSGSISFDDFSLTLPVTPTGTVVATVGGENGPLTVGDTATGPVRLYQDSSGGDAWNRHTPAFLSSRGWPSHEPRFTSYVRFRGYQVSQGGTPIVGASGNRALGWLDINGANGGVAVGVVDFWQNFPKALSADTTGIAAHLFPADFAKDHTFRVGEAKTHDVLIHFHGPGETAQAIHDRFTILNRPPFAVADTAWYANSAALGPFAPRQAGVTDAYDTMVGATLDPINRDPRSLLTKNEQYDFFGWQDFGDVLLDYEGDASGANGHTNLKYNFNYGMWLQYLRTGDRRWFDFAYRAGRHISDQDILWVRFPTQVHFANNSYFGHSYHSQQGHTNPNRNTGGLSVNVAYGPPGNFLQYFLTGDMWAREGALAISDSVRWRLNNNQFIIGNYNVTFGNGQGYIGSRARTYANGVWIMVDAFNATGDTTYLDAAEVVIAGYHVDHVPWLQPGTTASTKPWQESNYLYALGRYLDTITEMGRADSAGARTHLEKAADYLMAEAFIPWTSGDDPTIGGFPYQTHTTIPDQVAVGAMGNWNTLGADAFAYAAKYGPASKRRGYLNMAHKLWRFGTRFPIRVPLNPVNWGATYALTYFTSKEAMNATVWGNAYLSELRRTAPQRPQSLTVTLP